MKYLKKVEKPAPAIDNLPGLCILAKESDDLGGLQIHTKCQYRDFPVILLKNCKLGIVNLCRIEYIKYDR